MPHGLGSRVLVRIGALAALVVGLATTPAIGADGDLDPSFGTDGLLVADFGRADNPGYAMALDDQDRVLLVGAANNGTNLDAYVARYTPDGVLDSTFGEGGVATINFGPRNDRDFDNSTALAIVLDADGRIVIGGIVLGTAKPGQGFPLARLEADGALDATFGKGGKVITPVAGSIMDLAITREGAIVAAGTTGSDVAIARYTPNGALDRSFGKKGVVTQDWGSFQESATGVAIDEAGRVVVAGFGVLSSSPLRFGLSVARHTEKGAPDRDFGNKGRASLELDDGARAQDLVLQDGAIVVVGSADSPGGTPNDFLLARFDDTGALDLAFGEGGITTTSLGTATLDNLEGVTLDPAGGIVVAGSSGDGVKNRAAVARYAPDGVLDPTFGQGAPVTTELPGNAYHASVAVQASGRAVAAGRTLGSDILLTGAYLLMLPGPGVAE